MDFGTSIQALGVNVANVIPWEPLTRTATMTTASVDASQAWEAWIAPFANLVIGAFRPKAAPSVSHVTNLDIFVTLIPEGVFAPL